MGSVWVRSVAVVGICIAAAVSVGEVVVVTNVKEANQLRSKLETAEGRVRELVSKLETVSVDATRAKTEIHETLHEAWAMVDLLSRDKCGDAVEKVRERQRDVEMQLHTLQDEVTVRDRQLLTLRRESEALASKGSDAAAQLESVVLERETMKKELNAVKDKLKVSESLFNQSSIYSSLAKSFHTMEQRIDERADLLRKIHSMLGKVSAEHEDISSAFGNLHSLVRQVDGEFHSIASSFHSEGAGGGGMVRVETVKDTQAVSRLEKELREAVAAKNAAQKEVAELYGAVASLKKGSAGSSGRILSSAPAVYTSTTTSWASILLALIVGAALMLLLSSLFRPSPATAPGMQNRQDVGGVGSSALRSGGPMYGSGPSPAGVAGGSASGKSYGMGSARGSPVTAAGAFSHMDRTPMQYVRSREGTPGYRK